MSRIVGCDAAGCAAQFVQYVPDDGRGLTSEVEPGDGWVELEAAGSGEMTRYDLCPAHAALLSDDQWRAREDEAPEPAGPAAPDPRTRIVDYAREPQSSLLEGAGAAPPAGSVVHVELECDPPLSPEGGPNRVCGWPARDHCAAHTPRHCPGACPG